VRSVVPVNFIQHMSSPVEKISKFLAGGECPNLFGLLLVHLSIFTYSLAFWIQRPVLSYLSNELGGDAVDFGTLESVLSMLALVGGPVMGRLTDEYGAKNTIIASHIGSFIMYLLMGIASNYTILALSRLPALLQHAMLCSQAAIADLTVEKNRSTAMGRLSLSYAGGMVIGSFIGGEIGSTLGYQSAALVAAAVTAATIAAIVIFMPHFGTTAPSMSSKETKQAKKTEASTLSALDQIKTFWSVAKTPRVRNLLFMLLPMSIGIGGFRSMLPLAAEKVFGLVPSSMGKYISFAAFVGLLTNVFIISPVTKSLGEANAVALSALVQLIGYSLMSMVSSYEGLMVLTVPMTASSTLLYTLSSSLMSLAVERNNTATAIAMSHGLRSFVGIVSPILGGYLYDTYEFSGVTQVAAILAGVTLVVTQTIAFQSLRELMARKAESSKRQD